MTTIVWAQDLILVTVTGGTDLWPVHAHTVLPLTFSSCIHRWYWPVTCPGTYGIPSYPFWLRRCHHRNMSSATNLQFRFDSSDSSYVNSRPLFLLKPRQDISGTTGSHLCRIDFNWWDYHVNIFHRGRINYFPSTDVSLCDALVAYLILALNSICELVQQQLSPWYKKYLVVAQSSVLKHQTVISFKI